MQQQKVKIFPKAKVIAYFFFLNLNKLCDTTMTKNYTLNCCIISGSSYVISHDNQHTSHEYFGVIRKDLNLMKIQKASTQERNTYFMCPNKMYATLNFYCLYKTYYRNSDTNNRRIY